MTTETEDTAWMELTEHIRNESGSSVFLLFKRPDGSFVYCFRSKDKDELLGAVEDALDRIDEYEPAPIARPH